MQICETKKPHGGAVRLKGVFLDQIFCSLRKKKPMTMKMTKATR